MKENEINEVTIDILLNPSISGMPRTINIYGHTRLTPFCVQEAREKGSPILAPQFMFRVIVIFFLSHQAN